MNYSVNLNITPGGMPPILHMSQYDTGRTYLVTIKDADGGNASLGTNPTAKVKGYNGKNCFEIDATVANSVVTFSLTEASTDQFGVFPVTIELTIDGQDTLSPLCMIFDVQKAGYTNEQAASSPEFENAMEEAAQQYIAAEGILLAENQAEKASSMTTPIGVDGAGKLWVSAGWSQEAIDLLIACFEQVAWATPQGQTYLSALETALNINRTLASIVADYVQDRIIYDTDSLDKIKEGDDLIVTAYYSDGTQEDLADSAYTLSGTLSVGTCTITVTYAGKTDEIEVAVTEQPMYVLPSATTFDGTSHIDTGVKLLQTDSDFTIYADFTNGTPLANSMVFDCRKVGGSNYGCGVYERSTGYYAFTGMVSTNVDSPFADTTGLHIKMAVRYNHTNKTFYMDGSVDGVSVSQHTVVTNKTIESIATTLTVGGPSNGGSSVKDWFGTVSQFIVYGRRHSDDEVAAWLGA